MASKSRVPVTTSSATRPTPAATHSAADCAQRLAPRCLLMSQDEPRRRGSDGGGECEHRCHCHDFQEAGPVEAAEGPEHEEGGQEYYSVTSHRVPEEQLSVARPACTGLQRPELHGNEGMHQQERKEYEAQAVQRWHAVADEDHLLGRRQVQ